MPILAVLVIGGLPEWAQMGPPLTRVIQRNMHDTNIKNVIQRETHW